MSPDQHITVHQSALRELENESSRIDKEELTNKISKALQSEDAISRGFSKMTQMNLDGTQIYRIVIGDYRAILVKERKAVGVIGVSKRSTAYNRSNRMETLKQRAEAFDLNAITAAT
jgi:mRNA-degrading endonuclease RelE of RelBE toxin-antitoxin system